MIGFLLASIIIKSHNKYFIAIMLHNRITLSSIN